MADAYDRRNSALAPISDSLHFLMRLVLADRPADARVLCVGVGTGAEILSLAKAYPGWSFVGIDPSEEMLSVARRRLEQAGVLDRCELVQGYAEDAPGGGFDAAVSLLVAHFIKREDRGLFYAAIHERLKPGGRFVSAEISGDLDAPEFPEMLEDWKRVQALMGATSESLAKRQHDARCAGRPDTGRDGSHVEGGRLSDASPVLPGLHDPRLARGERLGVADRRSRSPIGFNGVRRRQRRPKLPLRLIFLSYSPTTGM